MCHHMYCIFVDMYFLCCLFMNCWFDCTVRLSKKFDKPRIYIDILGILYIIWLQTNFNLIITGNKPIEYS
jgi:hypothetical protein